MTNYSKIKILLVDDHEVVRLGYRALIGKQPGMEVVAEAADGKQAYQYVKRFSPDVTIMDLSMPGLSGVETIARLRQRDQKAKVLVFTMHQNHRFALQALKAGALGYVTKSSTSDILLQAIRDVFRGRLSLSPDIAHALAMEKIGREAGGLEALTTREFEILRLLASAKSKDEIAGLLNISQKTVSNCHYLIKSKFGVTSDIELMHLAIRINIIDPLEITGAFRVD